MILEKDRDALVKYRIQQAADTLKLAEFLITNGKLTVAVNRIYYGMFYALSALALKHRFETSKHGHLIGWFNKDFISSGQVDPKFGKSLRNAFQNRTKGDYDAFAEFTLEEASLMLGEMSEFINEITRLVKI